MINEQNKKNYDKRESILSRLCCKGRRVSLHPKSRISEPEFVNARLGIDSWAPLKVYKFGLKRCGNIDKRRHLVFSLIIYYLCLALEEALPRLDVEHPAVLMQELGRSTTLINIIPKPKNELFITLCQRTCLRTSLRIAYTC